MFGPQPKVEGLCNAELHIGDDYGDNHATMRCKLKAGHGGLHEEVWRNGLCRVTWDGDDTEPPTTDLLDDQEEGDG